MSDTPNLGLPLIAVGQGSKEVTHNAALAALDALVQAGVINATTTAPPGSPADGDVYLVATGGSGAWSGHDGEIAAYYSGWIFAVPDEGWAVFDRAAGRILRFDGSDWLAAPEAQIPSLGNSWIGYGSGYQTPRYYRSADGLVTIEGLVQSGTDGVIFTLLSGFRPAAKLMFVCWSAGGAYRVTVDSNGDVELSGSNSTFSSLAGISFYAQ